MGIIKRNHHHHHRQNVTPAYRRDTTHSKPAIRAIETKEYLPSIARETERETERQRDRVKNGTDSDERRRKGEIGATWVASFGVRLWGRRVRDNQRLAVLMENVELGVKSCKRRRHLVDGEWKNVHGMETRFVRGKIFARNVQALELCKFCSTTEQLWVSQVSLRQIRIWRHWVREE